jgi:peptidoglycan/LPS O-acetylase OafA/YrhL
MRLLIGIGKISYGLYLTHAGVIHFFGEKIGLRQLGQGDLPCLIFFALTLVAASVISYLLKIAIEDPCIALGRGIISSRARHVPTSD